MQKQDCEFIFCASIICEQLLLNWGVIEDQMFLTGLVFLSTIAQKL